MGIVEIVLFIGIILVFILNKRASYYSGVLDGYAYARNWKDTPEKAIKILGEDLGLERDKVKE